MSAKGNPSKADILVRNAYVITMNDEGNIVEHGAIAIKDGVILAVGDDRTVAGEFSAATEVDAGGAPVHPGFIECHLHASFQIFRGALPDQLRESDSFDSFESHFFNEVTDEEEYISCLLAAIEMVRNGTTCFMEAGTVLEPEMAAQAAERVGIRAVLADAFIWDQPQGFAQGMEKPEESCVACAANAKVRQEINRAPKTHREAIAKMGGQLSRNRAPNALVRGHVAILGLGTASQDLMLEAKQAADAASVVLNLHQSYSPADTEADRQRFGDDPLVHLERIGFLDQNVTLGHANHLTDAECQAILNSGTSIAWAPAASMMWGHGGTFRGRHAELWRKGANIALGSDSANWSNDFDLWRQASLAVMTAREAHVDRGFLVAEDGLEMATRAGAKAVGLDDRIGSIEPGRRADIVVHTLDRPEMVPSTNLIRNLFYASRSKSVDTVIIDGRIVLLKGEFPSLDEPALLHDVRVKSEELLKRMGFVVPANSFPGRRSVMGCGRGAN